MTRVTFEANRYPLREGETVLSALLRGGARPSFSCKKGTCQACMLEATSGDPGPASRVGLRESLASKGCFLPCQSRPLTDLEVRRPDPRDLLVRAHVVVREPLSSDVVRLRLQTETAFSWRAGQYVNVHHGGLVRSYSIASVMDVDDFLELHVRRVAGGVMSGYLCDEVAVDDVLEIQGPLGSTVYPPGDPSRTMVLVATGTGLAPMLGVIRDAFAHGHTGDVFLYHGARHASSLYLDAWLRDLEHRHPRFYYVPCVSSRDVPAHAAAGRSVDIAFARHRSTRGLHVYLAGNPDMVYEGRHRAFEAGAAREDIRADAFEHAHPFTPDDAQKVRALAPDLELWAALRDGAKLKQILTDFYDRVYDDPRLSPFFHKVTKQRAIEKQYEFLSSIFTGDRRYFGLNPFNAHHWMVISDELFDYRETLFEECVRAHGLAEHLVRRWLSLHELFRREIVKASPRGLFVDGVERYLEGYTEESLSIGSLCDGCEAEMQAGTVGRMHVRTGQLFCTACAARRVGATEAPITLAP